MRFLRALGLGLLASVAASARPSGTSGEPLTAARVANLAAARAPLVLIAETRVLEARGRLAGARALAEENPVVEGFFGSENDPDRTTEAELQIPFGLGWRRNRRIAESRAAVEREQHLLGDARRRAMGFALSALYRVLHAEERHEIAGDRRALAEELRRVVSERVRTGDAARLELLVAEVELSRAESEALSEAREVAHARRELATALGLPSGATLEVSGELSDRSLFETQNAGDPDRRADVLAAESEVKAAEAGVSFQRAAAIPELSLRVSYERSRAEDVVRPGLAVSLPIFNHGQGPRAEAGARRDRAIVELSVQRALARAEIEGAQAAFDRSLASVRELETRGLPRAAETEALARQGFVAGKLDLPALLVVRANALDARREHADRLLDAALTGIDLAVAAGSLPAD
jgi:cobalt-zinc-cadmium efflux system outer membrane protein